MRFGSLCSGIEAASVAWAPLGWCPSFLSEIDPFARAVLEHRHPSAPLHDDFLTIGAGDYDAIDVLVGGTPCQSFSVAGLRKGLDDARGNLALGFLQLAGRLRPRWVVWENVPGVLSVDEGRAFGSFLGGLAQLGYGFAYRVLDAQYCRTLGFRLAVPQRRRRVFVVGYLGDWRRAVAVLFEPACLSGDPPPRRVQGQGAGRDPNECAAGRGRARGLTVANTGDAAYALLSHGTRGDLESETILAEAVAFSCKDHGGDASAELAPTLRAMGHDGSHANAGGQLAVAIQEQAVSENLDNGPGGVGIRSDGAAYTLEARTTPQAVAFDARQSDVVTYGNRAGPLDTDGTSQALAIPAAPAWRVRRLTPTECERLQGFPDGYTAVPYRRRAVAPDGPRYRALGNSMAVPVMRALGRRIAAVEAIPQEAP